MSGKCGGNEIAYCNADRNGQGMLGFQDSISAYGGKLEEF
jgi:hypothetical protein